MALVNKVPDTINICHNKRPPMILIFYHRRPLYCLIYRDFFTGEGADNDFTIYHYRIFYSLSIVNQSNKPLLSHTIYRI